MRIVMANGRWRMTHSVAMSLARVRSSGAGGPCRRRWSAVAMALAAAFAAAAVPLVLHAERRQLDAEKSTLTV